MGNAAGWASWSDYRNDERLTVSLPNGGDCPCALFFPSSYEAGIANLGFHYIYRTLRELGIAVERFFESPLPYRSVEHDTMLERFPLVLAGISYETGVISLARWLAGGGISPSRESRGEVLVGAGGAVTYINPLPLSAICDFVILGDGVGTVAFLASVMRRGRRKDNTLAALADHPSIYVPSIHGRGRCALKPGLDDIAGGSGRGTWITPRGAFGDTLLLEPRRGCARKCGFCAVAHCFGPVRAREADLIIRDMEEAGNICGFSRIGLVTPEAGDYAGLDRVLEAAERMGSGVSFASLRADNLSERMVRALVRNGRRSVTIAPESGDDMLRERCGKRFTCRDVAEKLKMAADCGAASAKMYFMIGLPGETEEHLLSIAELCAMVRAETGLSISAAISPFVPKPRTPWEGENFDGEKKIKAKYSLISRSFGTPGVKPRFAGIKEACVEHAVSWAGENSPELIPRLAASRISPKELESLTDKASARRELERLGLTGPHRRL